ncbi:MAG: hypothetical protein GC205_12675 [Bacteroidetes bacterium]|nr:hypothetical protein [Bacteroidota bacterium]
MKQRIDFLKRSLVRDILAGLTVSFAALSLGAAFGVMSGRGAFAGMLAAAVIPIITSLFGGTRLQASGPTAPMTSISAILIAFAYDHFHGDPRLAEQYITFVLLLSSVFIALTGIFRLGRFITKVPQVVVLGFMNGIAVIIWKDQLIKLFALHHQEPLMGGIGLNSLIAFGVLLTIYAIPFLLQRAGLPLSIRRFIPSIFVTIVSFTALTTALDLSVAHVSLGKTVGSLGEFGQMVVNFWPSDPRLYTSEMLLHAVPLALQLCVLAYLDSLLTSLVIDKMTREKTKHDRELLAQGLANGVTAILQGIPGAQATIRSVLLLKEGAQSRMAGVFVGLFTLVGFLVFGKLMVLIASAVFIGVLFKAGLDVFDRDFPMAFFRYGWMRKRKRNIQLFFIAYTTIITVVVDLNVAVLTGTVFFYLAQHFLGAVDVEADFSEVHSEELLGASIGR